MPDIGSSLKNFSSIIVRLGLRFYAWIRVPGRPFIVLPGLCLFISILSLLLSPGARDRIFLSFPDGSNQGNRNELRYIPRSWTSEAKARRVLGEILIGPAKLNSVPIIDRDTRIRILMVRKGLLFVDLSADFILSGKPGTDFKKPLRLIASLLKKNVAGVRRVIITVEGNMPYDENELSS